MTGAGQSARDVWQVESGHRTDKAPSHKNGGAHLVAALAHDLSWQRKGAKVGQVDLVGHDSRDTAHVLESQRTGAVGGQRRACWEG